MRNNNIYRNRKFNPKILIFTVIVLVLGSLYIYRLHQKQNKKKQGIQRIHTVLNSGYKIIQGFYAKVKKGDLSKQTAINEIKLRLSGSINSILLRTPSLSYLNKFFNTLRLKVGHLIIKERTIQSHNKIVAKWINNSIIKVTNKELLRNIDTRYSSLDLQQQRALVDKYKLRILRNFSKLPAHLRLGKTAYIWVMTGNPNHQFEGKTYEVIHPSLEGVNVWKTKNWKGTRVGKDIAEMGGKIDNPKIRNGAEVYYQYLWKNPSDKRPRKKIMLMKYFKPWNWVVCAGIYEDQLYD